MITYGTGLLPLSLLMSLVGSGCRVFEPQRLRIMGNEKDAVAEYGSTGYCQVNVRRADRPSLIRTVTEKKSAPCAIYGCRRLACPYFIRNFELRIMQQKRPIKSVFP